MEKLMSVTVRGRHHQWGFLFYGDPKHLEDWRADGLEVSEVENVIPERAPVRLWCFLQDLFHFRNPWRK